MKRSLTVLTVVALLFTVSLATMPVKASASPSLTTKNYDPFSLTIPTEAYAFSIYTHFLEMWDLTAADLVIHLTIDLTIGDGSSAVVQVGVRDISVPRDFLPRGPGYWIIMGLQLNRMGRYEVVLTLHHTSNTEGVASMTVNGLDPYPEGMTLNSFGMDGQWSASSPTETIPFYGNMMQMQVFYNIFGGGWASSTVSFEYIAVTGAGDNTPPVTTISLSGIPGTGDWFRSDVTVTLTATDDLSGVSNTEFRLSDTSRWIPYTGPFLIITRGETTVYYRSIDNNGNVESTKTKTVMIETVIVDKIAPEGIIMFNAETKDIDVIGVDDLATYVNVAMSIDQSKGHRELRTYTLVDDAGNTLKLKIEVEKTGKELKAELVQATYIDGNGTEVYSFQKNKLKIGYSEDKKTGDDEDDEDEDDVKDLEQELKVEKQFTVHTEYNHKKDETKIKIHPYKQKAEKYTVEGMWMLGVTTNRGKIGYTSPPS